jgi:outer membrane protein OmpA-like peptidoglycan-associated protein
MRLAILFIFTFVSISAMGQKSPKEVKADNFFRRFSFHAAIERYVQIDGLSNEGLRNLAVAYKNTGQIEKSIETYMKFIETESAEANDYYNYSYVLRLFGSYEQSDVWMEKFKLYAPSDFRSISYKKEIPNFPNYLEDKGQFSIHHLSVNTEHQDFGPAYWENSIVFASTREGIKSVKRKYNWNNLPFLDLYVADIDSVQLFSPRLFSNKFSKKYHDGPASFSANGSFMAFTRNNYTGKSSDGTRELKIFFAERDNQGNWAKPTPFYLNNKDYSIGHPHLSANGTTMYFASNMPGGIGGVDIYKVTKNDDGTWGEAKNLGAPINTEGDEMFPFYHEVGKLLFFASNGHLGLGGLDVFVSPDQGNGMFTTVQNCGAPLNSKYDDFALILDSVMKKGYYTSNRSGGSGDDDIYAFNLLKPFNFGVIIRGTAFDNERNILANTNVDLLDDKNTILGSIVTKEDGKYEFEAKYSRNYALRGTKMEYTDGRNTASTFTTESVVIADVVLKPVPQISLYILITDKRNNNKLEKVSVTIIDKLTGEKFEHVTGISGDYLIPKIDKKINDPGKYDIFLVREGYFPKEAVYETIFSRPGRYNLHEFLDLSMDEEVEDLSQMVQINPINFDLDKHNIRPDAAIELDKIVEIMNRYPRMVVELGSHTDCRGSIQYNLALSDRRAKSSAEYIKQRIPNPERIYGKGFGESRLLNSCACEGAVKSTCPEEEHAKNRRTEFRVISSGNNKVKVNATGADSFD